MALNSNTKRIAKKKKRRPRLQAPPAAGLLKAFIEYTLSAEGQASLEGFRFTGVTADIITRNTNALSTVLGWH